MIKVIDFWAPWCGPCKTMAPTIDKLADEYANSDTVQIQKVNVDDNMDIARLAGIRSIPTLVFYKDDEEVNRMTGAKTESEIRAAIEAIN